MYKVGDRIKTECANDDIIRSGVIVRIFGVNSDLHYIQIDDKKYNDGDTVLRNKNEISPVGDYNSGIILKEELDEV